MPQSASKGLNRWITQPSLYGGIIGATIAGLYGVLTLDLPPGSKTTFFVAIAIVVAVFSVLGDAYEQRGLRVVRELAEVPDPSKALLKQAVVEATAIGTRCFWVNALAFISGSVLVAIPFYLVTSELMLSVRIACVGTMFGPCIALFIYLLTVSRSRELVLKIASLGLSSAEVIEANPPTRFTLTTKLMWFTGITAVTPTVLIADVTLRQAERAFIDGTGIATSQIIAIVLLTLLIATLVIGSAWVTGTAISKPLVAMENAATRLSSGDLRSQSLIPAEDETWAASAAFASMQQRLGAMLAELQRTGTKVASSAEQLVSAASLHETGTTQQVPALHETSATTEELARSARQIAQNATGVARIAERTLSAAQRGQQGAEAFSEAMDRLRRESQGIADSVVKLNKRVQQVGKVVEFINEIADKADLLALNAELEGTKAGDVGRGFSLVASEMRRLAENVISSTQEIQGLIVEIRDGTQTAVMATESGLKATDAGAALSTRVSDSLQRIHKLAAETSDAVRAISLATQQQQSGTDQLAAAMGDILRVTNDGAEATRKMSRTNYALGNLSRDLKKVVERFQV